MARLLALLVAVTCFLVPTGSPASATPDHFNPHAGATFNNPLGSSSAKRAIFHRVLRAINSSPRGSDIRIFSWNYLTREGTDALLAAQRRGVRVRLLMDASNNTEIPNQPYRRLRAGLHNGNAKVKPGRRSWAGVCQGSCRGSAGVAHSKFYMFSKVGSVPRVVMEGSANFTVASTSNQWNDVVTFVRSTPVWDYYGRIFREATADKRAPRPYASKNFNGFRLVDYPIAGRGSRDPVMELLNKVACRGAGNTASHRTVLRIAPDVIRQQRGMALARKVRSLWNHGCDIRIGYTVVGIDVGKLLRSRAGRGPVPMKHLVQDYNGDGEFDNYFHLKAMTIVGNVAGKRSNYVALNGSANWSGLARASDENVGIFWSRTRTLQYQQHLNYWYDNFPTTSGYGASANRRTTRTPAPDRLVFGTGKNAVFEDGTPYSRTGVDPYAHLEMD